MADGLNGVITKLEQQKSAIERALTALREIESPGTKNGVGAPATARKGRAKRKGGMTPEGKARLIAALKKRWAAKKAAAATRKGGITPEGRRRLAAAMKRRWAIKRTAAQAKARGGRKKAG